MQQGCSAILRKRRSVFQLLAIAGACGVPAPVLAAANAWRTAASGAWESPGAWTLNRTPIAGDDASISGGGVTYIVTSSAANNVANSLTIGSPASLNVTSGQLSISSTTTVTNTGGLVVSGGIFKTNFLDTGGVATRVTWTAGTIDLGTGLEVSTTGLASFGNDVTIGPGKTLLGQGSTAVYTAPASGNVNRIIVSGGTVRQTGDIFAGIGTGNGEGQILISSGHVEATDDLLVGINNARGRLEVSGSNSSAAAVDAFVIGGSDGAQASGIVTLGNGGSITSRVGAVGGGGGIGTMTVGSGTAPLATWTNSTDITVATLAATDPSFGTSLGGTLTVATGGAIVNSGKLRVNPLGTLTVSGGSVTTRDLDVSSAGTFNFPAGSINVASGVLTPKLSTVPYHYHQGTNALPNSWAISSAEGSTNVPSLTLSGGATVANAGDSLVVGNSGGQGSLTVTGPNSRITLASAIEVGLGRAFSTSDASEMTPAVGTLSVTNGGQASAPFVSIGTFGGTSTSSVSGAGSSITTGSLAVGNFGFIDSVVPNPTPGAPTFGSSGTLNVDNGGRVSSANNTFVGYLGGTGVVNVDGANSLLDAPNGTLFVGYQDLLFVSTSDRAEGTVNVRDGARANTSVSVIGARNGLGVVTVGGGALQSSWTNTATIHLGGSAAAGPASDRGTGTLNLTPGGNVSSVNLNVGQGGTGTVNQAGGRLTVSGALSVGTTGGTGTYLYDGGTLTAASLIIGHSGTGTFVQKRGTLNFSGPLTLGLNSGSLGTYTVEAGPNEDLSFLTVPSILVGTTGGGDGVLNQTGGTLIVNDVLRVATANSRVNFSGGTLNLRSLDLQGDALRLNWTNGPTGTASNLIFSDPAGLIVGGSSVPAISVPSQGLLTVFDFTSNKPLTIDGGTVTVDGGKVVASSTTVTGGGTFTVRGQADLTQAGTFTLDGGTLRILSNYTFGPDINLGVSGGTIEVAPSATLTLNGSVLSNAPIVKSGSGTLALSAPVNTSGAFSVGTGILSLRGGVTPTGTPAGSLPNVSSVEIRTDGTLELNNSAGFGGNISGPGGRLNDDASVILSGGTVSLIGVLNGSTTEILGPAVPTAGASTISVVPSGPTGTATLTFDSLGARATGATVDFTATPTSALGGNGKILFVSSPGTGFMGGWAVANGVDFAKYDPAQGVIPFAVGDYTPGVNLNTHALVTGSTPIGPVPSLLTLKIDTAGAAGTRNLTQTAGTTLTLSAGGLIKSGTNAASISGGDLTSGTSDLVIFAEGAGSLDIGSRISGNIALTKSGTGTVVLSGGTANTYTGLTYVNRGTLNLNRSVGTLPGDVVVDGGTLLLSQDNQIADAAKVTVRAGTFNLNGRTETIADLEVSGGTLVAAGGTLNVNSNTTLAILDGTTTYSAGNTTNAVRLRIEGGVNTVEAGATVNVGAAGLVFTGTKDPSITLNSVASGNPGQMVLAADVTATLAPTRTASILNGGGATVPGTLGLGGAERLFTVTGNGSALLISARVANGTVRKEGGGTLRLAAANTFGTAGQVGLTVALGTVEAQHPQALGAGTVALTGGNLALLSDAGQTTFGNAVRSNSATFTLGRVNPAPDAATGVGRMVLGALTVEGTGDRVLTVSGPAGVTGSKGGTLRFAGDVSLGTHTRFDNAVDLELAGRVSGAANLTKSGAGTMTLGDATGTANTYSGSTTVNGGTLLLNKPAGVVAVPGNLTINGPGTVRLAAAGQIASSAIIDLNSATGPATLDLAGRSQSLALVTGIGTVLTGGGSLSVAGSYGGAGTTTVGAGGSLSAGGIGQFTGGTLAGGTWTVSGTVSSPAVTAIGGAASVTLSGPGAAWPGMSGLGANAGTFTVANGQSFSTTGTFSNTGTVNVTGLPLFADPAGVTATTTFTIGGSVQQQSGGVLTGGTWNLSDAATLALPAAAADLTTIGPAARVSLVGAGTSFPKLDNSLATIQGQFSVAGGKTFTTPGPLNNDGTLTAGAGGSLSVTGPLRGTGGAMTGTTTVATGATLVANSITQQLLSISGQAGIRTRASGGGTSAVNVLTLAGAPGTWTGRLDLADTALVVDYDPASGSPLSTVADQIASGRAGGAWTGPGITSSAAGGTMSLGVAEASRALGTGGGTFQGVTVDGSAVLVRLTRLGDANVDGSVNGSDLSLLLNNFGATTGRTWQDGDFNYDRAVNGSDLSLLLNNFGGSAGLAALTADEAAQIAALGESSVPEPGGLAVAAGLGAVGLLARRRAGAGAVTCRG